MFTDEEIRKDHWRKTSKVKTGKGNKCLQRDVVDIKDPQGKKFLECQIKGIPKYTRVENADVKGGVVLRKRYANA